LSELFSAGCYLLTSAGYYDAMRKVKATAAEFGTGIPADQLSDEDLFRELWDMHRTRNEALRHGSDQALVHHDERMAELEAEYLRRFPGREIDPQRLREGARARIEGEFREPAEAVGPGPGTPLTALRTGAEQPWDPEDLAVAEGRDPTPANVERARRELAEEGPAAIERTVP
jgi:hypothetical protein